MSRLLIYSLLMLTLIFNGVALAQDADTDGVLDEEDNCVGKPNGYNETHLDLRQRDTNLDGYGNICDPDFNNDGFVDGLDYITLAGLWGARPEDPDYDPDVDLNGDDVIDGSEYIILASYWGQPPGPSGLSCGGTIPCIADRDGDGVANVLDSCVGKPNANQVDTNSDGFGNACDPDWNNDGTCGEADYDLLAAHWGHDSLDPWDFDISVDGNGVVGAPSYMLLAEYPNAPPGPSGFGDPDADGWADKFDNCPLTPNPSQADNFPGNPEGDACDDELVDVAYGENVGQFSALTDSTGKIHVLFVGGEYDRTYPKSIRYLHQIGSEWVVETVRMEDNDIVHFAADLASNDRPCMMWKTATSHRYGCLDGDNVLQIHPEEIPWKTSHTWYRLKLDQDDNPHILNYTHTSVEDCVPNTDCSQTKTKNHHLRYQMFNGTSWTPREHLPVRPTDARGNSMVGTLVIDKATGVVYAIYGLQSYWNPADQENSDPQDLVIAARDPITGHWGDVHTKVEGVVFGELGEMLDSVDAVLDDSGNVHIVYRARSGGIKAAYYVTGPIDGVWERTLLDGDIGFGSFASAHSSITVDASGVVKIGLQLSDIPNGLAYFRVWGQNVSKTRVYVDGEDHSHTNLTPGAGTPLIFTSAKPVEADDEWGRVISYYDTSLAE